MTVFCGAVAFFRVGMSAGCVVTAATDAAEAVEASRVLVAVAGDLVGAASAGATADPPPHVVLVFSARVATGASGGALVSVAGTGVAAGGVIGRKAFGGTFATVSFREGVAEARRDGRPTLGAEAPAP